MIWVHGNVVNNTHIVLSRVSVWLASHTYELRLCTFDPTFLKQLTHTCNLCILSIIDEPARKSKHSFKWRPESSDQKNMCSIINRLCDQCIDAQSRITIFGLCGRQATSCLTRHLRCMF